METFLLVVHLLIAIGLVAVVLLQSSEGGGLGIGGSSFENFGVPRATGNILTRITVILACCFFLTSLGLSLLSRSEIALPPSESFDETITPDLPELPSIPEADTP